MYLCFVLGMLTSTVLRICVFPGVDGDERPFSVATRPYGECGRDVRFEDNENHGKNNLNEGSSVSSARAVGWWTGDRVVLGGECRAENGMSLQQCSFRLKG